MRLFIKGGFPDRRFFTKVTVLPHFRQASGEVMVGLLRHPKTGWQLVGGSAEKGETPLQAARRELVEETGLDVDERQFSFVCESSENKPVLAADVPTDRILLRRGFPVTIVSQSVDRYRVRYTEYIGQEVDFQIEVDITFAELAATTTRHFYRAELDPPAEMSWQHKADGHIFRIEFFSKSQLPDLPSPFDSYLANLL